MPIVYGTMYVSCMCVLMRWHNYANVCVGMRAHAEGLIRMYVSCMCVLMRSHNYVCVGMRAHAEGLI
jgi:hypothetical protein